MIGRHPVEYDTLIICGTARDILDDELAGAEVWSVGITKLEQCNRYYELHGLESKAPKFTYRDVPLSKIHALGLPLKNTVCVMLACAIVENRHKNIKLLATPLMASSERIAERPSVAFLVGYAKALGFNIFWEDGININGIYMGGQL